MIGDALGGVEAKAMPGKVDAKEECASLHGGAADAADTPDEGNGHRAAGDGAGSAAVIVASGWHDGKGASAGAAPLPKPCDAGTLAGRRAVCTPAGMLTAWLNCGSGSAVEPDPDPAAAAAGQAGWRAGGGPKPWVGAGG